MNQPDTGSPVFIVGATRTGTTLLRSILDAHPEFSVPRETEFYVLFNRYIEKQRLERLSNIKQFRELWQWYTL